MPRGEEAAERGLLGRLDLAPERGEGGTAEPAEHVGIAPLALGAAGPELAADEQVGALEVVQQLSTSSPKRSAASAVVNGPRLLAKRSRSWRSESGAALEERLRQPARRHHAERVAVAAGVLGRDQPLLAGDPGRERAPLGEQDRGLRLVVLACAQVAAAAEDVVQLVGIARIAGQLPLDLGERIGVDQLAQLLLAEQLAEQVAVERERLRAALGRRRVVLVHVGGDVVEEERAGEGRGRRRLHLDEVELARLQARAGSSSARAGRRRPAGTRGRSRG